MRCARKLPSRGLINWNAVVVSRYDLIVEVLRQPEKFSSKSATGRLTKRQVAKMMAELVAEDDEIAAMVDRRSKVPSPPVLVFADPPVHGQQRELVNRAFSPPAIREAGTGYSDVDDFLDRSIGSIKEKF